MREYIEERVLAEAHFIANAAATVRSAAKQFGISKSTVHKDMTERLPFIDHALYERVRHVFSVNMAERHIRGGQATFEKYKGK